MHSSDTVPFGTRLRRETVTPLQGYSVPTREHDPEQFRAVGWCDGRLCSVIFEIKRDEQGEYYHLVTAGKATTEEEQSYAENT